jgi:cytoskeleton protein RodZ
MQIAFVGESWVEIRDSEGNVQFSGTVPAGSTRSFEVQPPVDVVVGNASGVRITYNDRPFDLASHANRNIARFRLE